MKYTVKIFAFLICTLASYAVSAQTVEDEAQAMYQKAEGAYDAHQYADCTKYLDKALGLLKKTNPKIMYLMAKNLNESIKAGALPGTLDNYKSTSLVLDNFFKTVDKNTYPFEKYTEMVGLKMEIREKIEDNEKRKILYESLKRREALFLKDTLDVYAAAFCKDFNEEILKHDIKRVDNNPMWACPAKLEYDPFQHTIKAYDSKNLKYWHIVHLLTNIVLNERREGVFFYTDKEYDTNYAKINADYLTLHPDKAFLGSPEAHAWEDNHKINFKFESDDDKKMSYDLRSAFTKMSALIKIMDTTGFADYYNNKFDDVKS